MGRITWQDIKRIVNIADGLLDDPKVRMAIQNHSEEEYYQKVLDEYNKDVSTCEVVGCVAWQHYKDD